MNSGENSDMGLGSPSGPGPVSASAAPASAFRSGGIDYESGGSILIAEDDRRVRESLVRALRLEGYEVEAVADGASALSVHDIRTPDLLLLDVSMPNADGLSVCRMLRERGHDTQVLMLTARHEVQDRVHGLDAGADDYLVKPFALEELMARVRVRMRAARSSAVDSADATRDEDCLRLGDLEIDLDGRRVSRAGRFFELSRTEFDLLELLVDNAGSVLSRSRIYDRVWDGELRVESKTLDVYIGYLRRKTEHGGAPRIIHTVRGLGYVARAG